MMLIETMIKMTINKIFKFFICSNLVKLKRFYFTQITLFILTQIHPAHPSTHNTNTFLTLINMHIVIAINESSPSQYAFDWMIENILKDSKAHKLSILTVVEPPVQAGYYYAASGGTMLKAVLCTVTYN